MSKTNEAYGDLIRLPFGEGSAEEMLRRMPLGVPASQGGIDEATLRDLLFRHPQTLPIASIDAAYVGAVPVCRELSTQAGFVDALYVNPQGCLTLAEFKLWRNPQARREVIGQILDYAKEIATWNYEDLQREVSRTLKRTGNVLYEQVRTADLEVDEAAFVDNVTRHLRRGEFLLLIIGDGIREGVESIVDFIQQHSGLHFNLALIEVALYRNAHDQDIVQPRVLARTELVRRVVYEVGATRDHPPDESDEALREYQKENLRFWTAVLDDFSFSDVTLDVPEVTKESTLYVKVRNSGFGDWGLSFAGYLTRSPPNMGCYLSCRKDIPQAVRVFAQVESGLDALRLELGDDLGFWVNQAERPRIGFHGADALPFGAAPDSTTFLESVQWMREKLDVLVSTLHPRLQRMLSGQD
ncbi:MAG: hypothetical protein OXI73_02605 [Rhodospirillales bacterium]|nr:hypothetical protein [Rhodospirillales bacterium]